MTRIAVQALVLLIPALAFAQAQDAPPPLKLSGFLDVNFALNANRPDDHLNFLPGAGTTAKRAGEFSLNLAALDIALDPKPVGAHLTLNVGSGTSVLHASEPAGSLFDVIYNAYGTLAVPGGSGLVLDAGVFPCHVGLEAFFSKDNWNYTRSWLGEFSPYYSAGVRATYAIDAHWSAQLHLINGWQTIGDVNRGKTLGTQIAWNSGLVSASLNGLFGPELPGDDAHWRAFGDFVLVVKPRAWLNLGANVDVGRQALPGGTSAVWHAAAVYLRLVPATGWAITGRGEYFADPDAGISGARQTLSEGTLTIEWRPAEALILKAEGRYDHSTKATFASGGAQADGTPNTTDAQLLALLGAVFVFQQ